MKDLLFLIIISSTVSANAQTIPKELWGKWIVRRELSTHTISCWDEKEAKKLLGTKIEYSAEVFRWNNTITRHPTANEMLITAEQFHDDKSGRGTNSSQVDFAQLGITAKQASEVSIHHSDANISGSTSEIPGDDVLIKDQDTLIFSICNIYFEAKRTLR